jgi:cation:H+ antiporter
VIGIAMLALAAVVLAIGAELFTENASGAGRRLGVSGLAVALLLAGAEPEEMLTAVVAALSGRADLAAGDAIGANVTMLTLVLGLVAVIRPFSLGPRVRQYAVGAAATGVAAALVLADGVVSRLEGLILVLVYVALVAIVWRRERRPPAIREVQEVEEGLADDGTHARGESRAPLVPLALSLSGLVAMVVGGWMAVEGAVRVVSALGIADSVIGLTLLALATTAELLALAVAATRRSISELAIAAVVGSAAYNATVSLGASALARPLTTSGIIPAAIGAALLPLALLVPFRGGRIGRLGGALLIGAYVVYVGAVVSPF